MKLIATTVEILQDNYQGGSGLPIQRNIMVEIPDDTIAVNIENATYTRIREKALNNQWGGSLKDNLYLTIVKIEILPMV